MNKVKAREITITPAGDSFVVKVDGSTWHIVATERQALIIKAEIIRRHNAYYGIKE